ncbi:MAG: ankyrin repeat domain-containing protein [Chlamydiota bacterium]
MFIRSFDLGGGGLKTAVLVYDTDLKQMEWIEPQTQLGKCPDEQEVQDWLRFCVKETLQKDLEEEIRSGYIFSFSLAGLDKLRSNPLTTTDLSILCNLPKDKVTCIDDGAAHLIASLHTLKEVLPYCPIWNFGIGTGVSLGYADNSHKVNKLCDLYKIFGVAPWNTKEPTTGQSVWKVCGAKCFDQIMVQENGNIEKSFLEFALRWKSYLEANILTRVKEMPAAIVFTGGHIDAHGDQFVKVLSQLDIPVPLFTGASASGLLGAAWHAVIYDLSQGKWLQCISSSSEEDMVVFLEKGIDVNQFNAVGDSALSLAIAMDQIKLAQVLIQHGAWVNLPNFSRICPLSLAVQKGTIAMVQLLLDSEADINAHDCWGRTALFFAKQKGNIEIEELLLSRGAEL